MLAEGKFCQIFRFGERRGGRAGRLGHIGAATDGAKDAIAGNCAAGQQSWPELQSLPKKIGLNQPRGRCQ
jgi:hypothetical protein